MIMKNNSFLLLASFLLLQLASKANSSPCETGWLSYGNICNKVVRKRVSWYDAEKFCKKIQSGHLAAIYTAKHQALIKCLISNTTETFWIRWKRKKNGQLQWSTRLRVNLDKKYNNKATHNYSDKCYTMMNKDQGAWRSVNCNSHHYFICQYSNPESSSIWQTIIGKVRSSLEILKTWFSNDKQSPMPSVKTECIVKSLQVTGDENTSNTPGTSRQKIASPKTTLVKNFSSSTKPQITSQPSVTSTLMSTQYSKATIPTNIIQATKISSLVTADNGRVMSGSRPRSGESSSFAVSSTLSIPTKYTKPTTTSKSHNLAVIPNMKSIAVLDSSNLSVSPQSTTVDLRLPRTSSSRPIRFSKGVQKRKNENQYNLTPILTKVLKSGNNQSKFSTLTERSTVIVSKMLTSPLLGVKHLSTDPNAVIKHAINLPISSNPHTPISNYLEKSSHTTIYSPEIQKHKKGNLKPILSHISPNSTPWSNHYQSPILSMFHHLFSKFNNASYNGSKSRIIHTLQHNRSDVIMPILKKKLSGKTLQELIKKTLGRHFKHSIMNNIESVGNGLPPVVNFGDFFKIVDYFVNICHEAEWEKYELEDIVKEIAENTEPFLKSSLSRRTLERYTKTLDYVDIEVMHVGVANVGNVNCHGKNGKWKVGKFKLLSKTKINETISISMILLNTPAISILNSTNGIDDGSSFLVSPLLSIVALCDQQVVQVSHTFTLEINRNVTRDTHTAETGDKSEEYDFSCVFLDVDSGLWSDFGCEVSEEAASEISCSCNHTTNFAILMQVRDFKISQEEEVTLSTISYIGCSISLITQFITIAVFTFIEILRCERTFVHRNLCLAIVGAQITFLAGIKAVNYKIACSMIALVLHYCYMSVFAWMLVEGLHLYSRVVRVFGSELYRKIYYSIFGWGMPGVLVVISAAADWDGYGTDKVCWLSISKDTIWAFVGPAVAIITVNIVILVCVTRIVMTSAKHGNQGQFDHVRAGVKGALFLIPILGMTWVFGLLSVNRNLIIFQYMFAVSNSLQGFFIFLFHVVLNSEVRQALVRLKEKRSLQRGDLSSTSSTSSNNSWNTKNLSEKAPRPWSRRVSPAQSGTSGIMITA